MYVLTFCLNQPIVAADTQQVILLSNLSRGRALADTFVFSMISSTREKVR